MDWLYPTYLWALLAVPVILALFGWAMWKRRKAMQRFGQTTVIRRLTAAVRPGWRRWKMMLVGLGALLLSVSLAGPRFGTKVREVERKGIDLMIALDVSLSMTAEDVAPNRLERAKNEIKKLLGELSGDRVGLILFAGDAFVQCPLTTDYNAVRLFLDVADPEAVATPGTDFHAAFQTALEAFASSSAPRNARLANPDVPDAERTQAILFVSDGENHVGQVESIRREARAENVVLFAAGVGETQGVPIPLYKNGEQVGFKKDGEGRVVNTKLEERALKALSQDGAYFRITRTSSALSDLPASLARLNRTAFGAEQFEEYDEKYQWPLAAALLVLLIEPMIRVRRSSRGPSRT